MSADTLRRLDLFATPLSGVNLIEASAGTGKTYTITGLYLRLVLEAGIPVERILVVTYTVAATAELKDRIRERLAAARDAFEHGSADPFETELLTRLDTPVHRDLALRRLDNAIRGFDQAAVYTIHGFCQRVLADSAFESGMAFETELLADERELAQEIVDDYWRRRCYVASPLFVDFLLSRKHTPESLLQDLKSHLGKPYLQLRGPGPAAATEALEAAFDTAYRAARESWTQYGGDLERLLTGNPALNGNKYRKTSLPGWCRRLDELLAPERPDLPDFLAESKNNPDRLAKFATATLADATKPGKTTPEHPFFVACQALKDSFDALQAAFEQRLRGLKAELLDYARTELAERKRRRRVQSYDDLLLNLYQALESPRGERLAARVRGRYPAALIDEFQDTDPVQYHNFRRIYAGAEAPVFLVGDPKQAIYSFRGADIFAYLAARRDAAARYTLDVNWRSDPELIRAVNALFGHGHRPFLFETIPFVAARPAPLERPALTESGQTAPPLRFWLVKRAPDNKPVAKEAAVPRIARAVAAEIARLLNAGVRGEVRLGERSLDGGDMAVLVRSHRQGRAVRRALMDLGVPSVQQAQDNVFESREALDLERLLMAVAEPGREALARAALATELVGESGEVLYALGEDERHWERRLESFHEYHRLWREQGFIRFFRALLDGEDIPRRLLAFRDGERRLTNLLHLGELLQAEALRARPGMEGLIQWLAQNRQATVGENKAAELRLESDENLVKIVTVHKSKGLEYPVVFCPFLWDGKLWTEKSPLLVFHDPAQDHQAVLDLGSDRQEQWRPLAEREELAENLRLLYVALTRAKQRCYVVWGNFKSGPSSALAWLLHPPPEGEDQNAMIERVAGLADADLRREVDAVAASAAGAIAVEPLPEVGGQGYRPPPSPAIEYRSRPFTGSLARSWRVTSFSALVAGGHGPLGAELPDYDAGAEAPEAPTAPRRDIFAFPRGARPGSCLHALYEHLDFTRAERAELETLTARTLAAHGFDPETWTGVVADNVENVLATPLDRGGNLRLDAVTEERRLNELEFYYPLARLEPSGLRRLLADHGLASGPLATELDALAFDPVRGYMKGYMDLVFEVGGCYYLVDYKSNWLGDDPQAYQEERLPAVMARDGYYLQYLIYVVALHRYLGLRLSDYHYDRHFGGVYYLFLRGMNPALGSGYGVFRDRPDRALVEALDAYLAGEG